MQNEDRQEISDTLKLLIHNNTKMSRYVRKKNIWKYTKGRKKEYYRDDLSAFK